MARVSAGLEVDTFTPQERTSESLNGPWPPSARRKFDSPVRFSQKYTHFCHIFTYFCQNLAKVFDFSKLETFFSSFLNSPPPGGRVDPPSPTTRPPHMARPTPLPHVEMVGAVEILIAARLFRRLPSFGEGGQSSVDTGQKSLACQSPELSSNENFVAKRPLF